MTKRRAKHIALMQWSIIKEDFVNDKVQGIDKNIITYKEVALNKLYARDKITLAEHDLIMHGSSCALCAYFNNKKIDVRRHCPLSDGDYLCSCKAYYSFLDANIKNDVLNEYRLIKEIINLIKLWEVK